jgi:muconolactone delta-isomerase
MEELKDIKGFVPVPDDSFFHLMLLIGVIGLLLLIGSLLWWWYRQPKRRRRQQSPQERAKEQLKRLNFKDTKSAVYGFSEYAQILSPDNEKLKTLLERLEIYKYKREVPPLSSHDKEAMQRIIKELINAK